MKNKLISIGFLLLFTSSLFSKDELRMAPVLSLDSAKEMAQSMQDEAKKNNVNVVIYILGSDGRPLVIHRDEFSGLAPLEWARNKAITSYQTKKQSKDLSKNVKVLRVDTISFLLGMKGGIPLVYKGFRVGAIGVSGAALDVDQSIAQKGLETFNSIIK